MPNKIICPLLNDTTKQLEGVRGESKGKTNCSKGVKCIKLIFLSRGTSGEYAKSDGGI